jgi:hypothetical protein
MTMSKRVTVTVTFEADEGHVSSDFYEAKNEIAVSAQRFAGQFGEVKRVNVSLLGWQRPSSTVYEG